MGLGGLAAVSLSDARRRALAARKILAEGLDPLEEGRALAVAKAAEAAKAITFREAADRYIATHQSSWRNAKHIAQWSSTLEAYAMPVFGNVSVATIDVDLVLKVLEPIWEAKNETARRVRGRFEVILDWATAGGLRRGENPARWKGLLEHRLSNNHGRRGSSTIPLSITVVWQPSWRNCAKKKASQRDAWSSPC